MRCCAAALRARGGRRQPPPMPPTMNKRAQRVYAACNRDAQQLSSNTAAGQTLARPWNHRKGPSRHMTLAVRVPAAARCTVRSPPAAGPAQPTLQTQCSAAMATMHLQPAGTRCCGSTRGLLHSSRRCLRPVRASSEGSSLPEEPESSKAVDGSVGATADIAFPKSGLFSIADPKAEVYSKAGERFDPTKKGGRFKPEFIWQTNWQEQLKRQEDLERQQEAYRQRQKAGGITGGTGPGVVSFSRLGSLNDLDVDLTEQLAAAQERRRAQQQAAAAAAAERQQPGASSSGSRGAAAAAGQPPQRPARSRAAASPSYQYKDLPTKNEARRFKRATRAAGAGTVPTISAVGSASPEEAAARAAVAAAERARYEALKLEFQAWAIGLGFVGTAGCWALYGNDVAISYALGASAGLTYLRLLSRTVDAVGDANLAGGMNSAIGQPRLLIPVLLALTYNRWNTLYAEQYGYHLDLYGMLVGFFTYKLAVLGRQGLALLNELSEGGSSSSSSSGGGSGAGAGGEQDGGDAMSLDRIFVRKVMSE